MKFKFRYLLVVMSLFFFILPLNTLAISSDYQDIIAPITGERVNDKEVILYLFHGDGCPHCASEIEWLKSIRDKYDNVRFVYYEVWYNEKNSENLGKVFEKMEILVLTLLLSYLELI